MAWPEVDAEVEASWKETPASQLAGTEAEAALSLLLDPPGIGDVLQNWEHLAAALLPPATAADTIRHIATRVVHPHSPTAHLLRSLPAETSLLLLFRTLRDQLGRLDVCFKLKPLLSNLSSASTSDGLPSTSLELRVPRPLGQPQISCFVAGTAHRVLLTFYPSLAEMDKKSEMRKHTLWLQKNLKGVKDVEVELVDKYLERNGVTSMSLAMERLFHGATAIIVLPSEAYFNASEGAPAANSDNPLARSLRYLHSQMNAELLFANGSNRRFFPVVWDHSDTERWMPTFLRNVLVFRWPRQHAALFPLLFPDIQSPSSLDSAFHTQSSISNE